MKGPISDRYVCGECGSDVRPTGGGGSKAKGSSVRYECTNTKCDNEGYEEAEPRIVLILGSKTYTAGSKETRTGLKEK